MRSLLRALARAPDPLSDAALLARYAADRDPAAFEVLVWRHGGMVLGVCRRHLRDAHAAEDAFQATFLVLARKAASVRGDTLPGFLHRVARRAAVRAATKTRHRRETLLATEPAARPFADGELAAVLDAEIDRLPDRLRQVVVLCYLDGESTEAAATRLGIPRGTVLSRLHTARSKLAARLTRRGVTPPVVGLTAVLTADQVAGGVRAAGSSFGPATILANEVLAMSGRKTVLAAAVGLVLAGGAGTSVGVLNAQNGAPPENKVQPAPNARKQAQTESVQKTADRDGEQQAEAQRKQKELRARLQTAFLQIDERLERSHKNLQFLTEATANMVDVSALQAELSKIDAAILSDEQRVLIGSERLKEAEAEAKVAGTKPVIESNITTAMNFDPQVQALNTEVATLSKRYRELVQQTEPNSPAAVTAKEKLDDAERRLAARRAEFRPEAIKFRQAEAAEQAGRHLDETRKFLQSTKQQLAGRFERRLTLVKRIAERRSQLEQLQQVEDEVRVAREVRLTILRLKLQAELGIDLPPTPPVADTRLETLTRQLAELRQSLSTPDGGSRLDAIERKLDELKHR